MAGCAPPGRRRLSGRRRQQRAAPRCPADRHRRPVARRADGIPGQRPHGSGAVLPVQREPALAHPPAWSRRHRLRPSSGRSGRSWAHRLCLPADVTGARQRIPARLQYDPAEGEPAGPAARPRCGCRHRFRTVPVASAVGRRQAAYGHHRTPAGVLAWLHSRFGGDAACARNRIAGGQPAVGCAGPGCPARAGAGAIPGADPGHGWGIDRCLFRLGHGHRGQRGHLPADAGVRRSSLATAAAAAPGPAGYRAHAHRGDRGGGHQLVAGPVAVVADDHAAARVGAGQQHERALWRKRSPFPHAQRTAARAGVAGRRA